MRNKKEFVFDEEKEAEKIVLNGFNGFIDYSKMYSVAKYFRQAFGYGAVRLERELIFFCTEQDKNFNPIVEAEYIKKWVSSALKYKLTKIDNITISSEEVAVIKKIKTHSEKRVIFATLIISKASKKRYSSKTDKDKLQTSDSYYVNYGNLLNIARLSKVTGMGEVKVARIFNKHNHLFTFYSAEKELVRLEFVSKTTDNAYIIEDLTLFIEYYNKIFK